MQTSDTERRSTASGVYRSSFINDNSGSNAEIQLEEHQPEMYTNDYGDDYSVVKRTHLFATEQEALLVIIDVHSSV